MRPARFLEPAFVTDVSAGDVHVINLNTDHDVTGVDNNPADYLITIDGNAADIVTADAGDTGVLFNILDTLEGGEEVMVTLTPAAAAGMTFLNPAVLVNQSPYSFIVPL